MTHKPDREFDVNIYLPLKAGRAKLVLDDVVVLLRALDPTIGPFRLQLGEDERDGPHLHDGENIMPFVTSDFGFMAISKLATIEVTNDRIPRSGVQDGIKISVHLQSKAESKIEDVVRTLESLAPGVGLICSTACGAIEKRFHLFVNFKLPNGSIESFVGRNHRTWVPGLFWWNCWSLAWLEERGVELDSVPAPWTVTRYDSSPTPHAIVRCKSSWKDWTKYADTARAWANATSGVFSIDEVRAHKPQDLNELSAIRYLREWD